jgi:hypothetical protein
VVQERGVRGEADRSGGRRGRRRGPATAAKAAAAGVPGREAAATCGSVITTRSSGGSFPRIRSGWRGINLYAYVGSDPVNRTDPTGKWCQLQHQVIDGVEVEVLHCENISPGDLWTIERYLGRKSSGLRELWSSWGWPVPGGGGQWPSRYCQGRFDSTQCSELADAFARLITNTNSKCSGLGTNADRRFESGRYRWHPEMEAAGWAAKFAPLPGWRIVRLGPSAFASEEALVETVAHEERHMQNPFAGSQFHHNDGTDSVYALGRLCAAL